jgi:phage terminase large subunit
MIHAITELRVEFAPKFEPLFRKIRYKVFYGGRGGAKTWSIARTLILKASYEKHRIGCFRELQNSIRESVHHTLEEQIDKLGLRPWFEITQSSIRCTRTGSEFIFKGLRSNAAEIKSTEGITIAWVEEAQLVSEDSWKVLIPTIRVEGSEIWISFNPEGENDPTYRRFVLNPSPDSIVVKVNWDDNPWFPETLNKERLWMLATDPDSYEHVWNGNPKTLSDAIIFRGKYVIDTFDDPPYPAQTRLFYGMDFGFSQDPIAATRSYITSSPKILLGSDAKGKPLFSGGEELWISHEAFGVGVEFEEIPQLIDTIPGIRDWPIKADSARPETISYLKRQGYNISAAEKWTGCVEDGIAHLKGFSKIHIHQRCKHMGQEARLYSYKIDKITGQVLPIIIDANNHGWDSERYALDGYIQRRGELGVWAKL